ncbi:hypothetical protein BKA83DRAFT_4123030 [Pisolithus microcarpus]|nr:hypothetical protein BKA83DRAFT_4123030 [Pisolithus microcarpus]
MVPDDLNIMPALNATTWSKEEFQLHQISLLLSEAAHLARWKAEIESQECTIASAQQNALNPDQQIDMHNKRAMPFLVLLCISDAPKSCTPDSQSPDIEHFTESAWILEIHHLPDPDGHYARLLNAHPDLAESQVVSPDVRDRQGILITPDYVEVEVILKLVNVQMEYPANYKAISPSKGKRRSKDDDDIFSQLSPTKKPLLLNNEKEIDFEVV